MEYRTVEQYRALIDHSTDIIAQFDEAGTIQFVSPSVEQILGYTPEELVGESAFDLLHPDDVEQVAAAFDQIAEAPGQSTKKQEHRFRHADGSGVWAESVTTNRTESALEGYVINSREITQRKLYEEWLEETTEELEALNQLIRHDVRNDMGIILGWGEVLEDYVDDEGQEYLQKILASGSHVIDLTENARHYAEAVTSETEIEPKPIPLRSTLLTELSLRREVFPEAEFVINDEIPDVAVMGNELLGSVFRNLLNNAVQHNVTDDPVVVITCDVRDEMVVVRVADNGPGIPDAQKESIFGEGEKGMTSQGTGLGLYLAHTLVNEYNGTIWVEDNDPTGTILAVQLPMAE